MWVYQDWPTGRLHDVLWVVVFRAVSGLLRIDECRSPGRRSRSRQYRRFHVYDTSGDILCCFGLYWLLPGLRKDRQGQKILETYDCFQRVCDGHYIGFLCCFQDRDIQVVHNRIKNYTYYWRSHEHPVPLHILQLTPGCAIRRPSWPRPITLGLNLHSHMLLADRYASGLVPCLPQK